MVSWGDILPIVISIAVIGIAIGYSIDIQDDIYDDLTHNTSLQSINYSIDASGEVADKMPTAVVVTMAAFVIGSLFLLYNRG